MDLDRLFYARKAGGLGTAFAVLLGLAKPCLAQRSWYQPTGVSSIMEPPWWFWSIVTALAALGGRVGWKRHLARHQREQLHLEAAIEAQTQELAHEKSPAEKANQAKSEFPPQRSPELRIPVDGVIGMMTALPPGSHLNEEQRDWARAAVGSAESRLPLPAAPDVLADLQSLQAIHRLPSRTRRLVLVADDNGINLKLASVFLGKLGCEVDVAGNGAEALECWTHRPYDAIFMDCQMPGVDGYEAARLIRAAGGRGQQIPIIATTASSMAGDRERCIAAGMTDYISKPFSLHDFERVLEKLSPAQ